MSQLSSYRPSSVSGIMHPHNLGVGTHDWRFLKHDTSLSQKRQTRSQQASRNTSAQSNHTTVITPEYYSKENTEHLPQLLGAQKNITGKKIAQQFGIRKKKMKVLEARFAHYMQGTKNSQLKNIQSQTEFFINQELTSKTSIQEPKPSKELTRMLKIHFQEVQYSKQRTKELVKAKTTNVLPHISHFKEKRKLSLDTKRIHEQQEETDNEYQDTCDDPIEIQHLQQKKEIKKIFMNKGNEPSQGFINSNKDFMKVNLLDKQPQQQIINKLNHKLGDIKTKVEKKVIDVEVKQDKPKTIKMVNLYKDVDDHRPSIKQPISMKFSHKIGQLLNEKIEGKMKKQMSMFIDLNSSEDEDVEQNETKVVTSNFHNENLNYDKFIQGFNVREYLEKDYEEFEKIVKQRFNQDGGRDKSNPSLISPLMIPLLELLLSRMSQKDQRIIQFQKWVKTQKKLNKKLKKKDDVYVDKDLMRNIPLNLTTITPSLTYANFTKRMKSQEEIQDLKVKDADSKIQEILYKGKKKIIMKNEEVDKFIQCQQKQNSGKYNAKWYIGVDEWHVKTNNESDVLNDIGDLTHQEILRLKEPLKKVKRTNNKKLQNLNNQDELQEWKIRMKKEEELLKTLTDIIKKPKK